jgi:hypothetical protein
MTAVYPLNGVPVHRAKAHWAKASLPRPPPLISDRTWGGCPVVCCVSYTSVFQCMWEIFSIE